MSDRKFVGQSIGNEETKGTQEPRSIKLVQFPNLNLKFNTIHSEEEIVSETCIR